MTKSSYRDSGVDYERLDAFKRACQLTARSTRKSHDTTIALSGDSLLVHIDEGLGTKHLVADAMFELTGVCHYRSIGIDLVASIVNDVAAIGASPLSVTMHVSAGSSDWFADDRRASQLIEGFAEGCRRAGAAWVGGETATLKDVVSESSIVLSGSAVGVIQPKSNQIIPSICDRDAIVFVGSSGVHANGLTLCRQIVSQLPDGYVTKLDDGRIFGEALLTPSAIYVDLVRQCQMEQIDLHNAIHITGHGWRKLMRPDEPFVYRIDEVRDVPPEIRLMIDHDFIDPKEAYATFNMGAGFALMVEESDVSRVIKVAQRCGHDAWRGGTVIKNSSEKSVEIQPLGIRYNADSLRLG